MLKLDSEMQLLLVAIRRLHERVRDAVVEACERTSTERLAEVAHEDPAGDTIYAVDKVSEDLLIDIFKHEVAPQVPVVLIAEGITSGKLVLPFGTAEQDAKWRIICDPIDGTRGLMYQKRSAWILTGVAPNNGAQTCLTDIELAVQTEIPLVKQFLCDVLWAARGQGAYAERINRLTNERHALRLRPSRATTIKHGFAGISRFFPGARDVLAAIDDEVVREALGEVEAGKAQCFEDQYLSSGGQLYELIIGHDRFIADVRPLLDGVMRERGYKLGICSHPYDLCTELIAREAGVIVTNERGEPLNAPLNLEADVGWVGYANEAIRAQIEPLLLNALRRRGLM